MLAQDNQDHVARFATSIENLWGKDQSLS